MPVAVPVMPETSPARVTVSRRGFGRQPITENRTPISTVTPMILERPRGGRATTRMVPMTVPGILPSSAQPVPRKSMPARSTIELVAVRAAARIMIVTGKSSGATIAITGAATKPKPKPMAPCKQAATKTVAVRMEKSRILTLRPSFRALTTGALQSPSRTCGSPKISFSSRTRALCMIESNSTRLTSQGRPDPTMPVQLGDPHPEIIPLTT